MWVQADQAPRTFSTVRAETNNEAHMEDDLDLVGAVAAEMV